MVKTKDGIGIWPAYEFHYRIDNNKRPYGEYKTWVPVDEGYFILLNRKYYYARNIENPGIDAFTRFYVDANDVIINYEPEMYKVEGRNVLEPVSPNYL